MKKKICFMEMLMVMALACACSVEQKEEGTQEETQEKTQEETVEGRDGESDNAPVDAAQGRSEVGTDDAAALNIAPDLNHNGIAEEVRLTDIGDGEGLQLEIWENDELIDREPGYFAHAGWTSIFLCTMDGEDYLLRYHPTMYQGTCMYDYTLSTLTDNQETVVRSNSLDFDINFGSFLHDDFDPEAIVAFMEEINDLLSHSVQMLNTDDDLLGTFEKEGRLYDSLRWLDGWEPVFSRNESKSLLENLQDFQTAMTAFYEPVVYEAENGLPITESLEMEFYSGAGAWRTCLTLNPDGSFVGDFYDDDMDTVYICQYHGKFGKVEKLTDASWLLTLDELELDTGYSVGEKWEEPDGNYTFHYISSEPYGFTGADDTALKPGAQFILYSPDAVGHEPGTELYGEIEFQSWMHKHQEFTNVDDILGCWGLQNMETGEGFFHDN